MSNKYEQKWNQVSYRYKLTETLSDSDFRADPSYHHIMPGIKRWENGMIGEGVYKGVYVHGECEFLWVCNRSGSDLSRGALVKFYTKSITATGGSTSTFVCSSGTFEDSEEVWNNLYILDDAGGAGAAPEGEFGLITKNTTTTLTIQTPASNKKFTAAVASGDTGRITSRCQVVSSAAGDQRGEVAGIVVASSLPDDYWGWVAIKGDYVGALVKASTAITVDKALIADTGRLTISSSSGQDLILAYALVGCSADIDSDFIPVKLDCKSLCATSA